MLRVGLTGGIACGKSTVAAMMRELGCVVFEADPLAHRLIEPGQPAYEEVIQEFGRQVCAPDGRIDRARLGQIVFADRLKLSLLNHIVHPRVAESLNRELVALERVEPRAVVVVEAALIIEAGYHKRLDRLVVVWCLPEQQIERLMDPRLGRGMTRQQAEQRISAQMPLDEKRRLADDEIDCSGSLEKTRRQVETLVAKFKLLAVA
ncbi:MAG TPA: dephospho-CoA kinase [Candidatus Acidoferrales bacterium]|nr:dephospho-CoA kinase [Candidatus Acidoferrales bacterium]